MTPKLTLPRRTKLKQFGSLWVQSLTATDYRDRKAKTYDLVWVKRHGRFRLNHIHPHEVVPTDTVQPPAQVYGGSGPCSACGKPSGTFIEGTALCPRCYQIQAEFVAMSSDQIEDRTVEAMRAYVAKCRFDDFVGVRCLACSWAQPDFGQIDSNNPKCLRCGAGMPVSTGRCD